MKSRAFAPCAGPHAQRSALPAWQPPAKMDCMKAISLPLRRLFLLLFLPLAGCQSARMAVPADLEARADAYPCLGRGGFSLSEKFSFGPYEVFQVKRGWTRRTTWTLVLYENAKARQQVEFSLRTPSGRTWQGQAATGVRQENLKSSVAGGELTWGLEKNMEYLARLGLPDQPTAWTMTLAEKTADDVPKGLLTDGSRTYQVAGTRNLAGTDDLLLRWRRGCGAVPRGRPCRASPSGGWSGGTSCTGAPARAGGSGRPGSRSKRKCPWWSGRASRTESGRWSCRPPQRSPRTCTARGCADAAGPARRPAPWSRASRARPGFPAARCGSTAAPCGRPDPPSRGSPTPCVRQLIGGSIHSGFTRRG
jgi:hypothetical protein